MTGMLLVGSALAQDAPPEPGPVSVEAGSLTLVLDGRTDVSVTTVGMPKPVVIDPKFRTCRIRFGWAGEAAKGEVIDGCHPNLIDAVEASIGDWEIEVGESPRVGRELLEVWTVFPDEKGEAVRLYARQRYDAELTATTDLVDVLPFKVTGRQFPEYPIEAVGLDTAITRCDVHVDVSGTGVPHGVDVTRCDEVFRSVAEDTLRQWRYQGNQLDGVPFQTGFTLGVQFTREYDREDGLPGTATVLVPDDPDLGIATQTRLTKAIEAERVAPVMPTWDPLLVLDHQSYAAVGVYEIRWPSPSEGDRDRRCPMLFQTNSERLVWAWAEEGCDPEVRAASETAGNDFNLKHGTIEKGERFARFRGRFVFPADGSHVELEIPADDLETSARDLPEYVHTFTDLTAETRIPPKLPRAFASEVVESRVFCSLRVGVDTRGRADDIDVIECPGSYVPFAVKALDKWRWRPAERDGNAVPDETIVRMRFDNQM